jgi:YD repeat-containing protein
VHRRLGWLLGIAALSSAAPASETTTFTYDALGRLVQSSNSGGPRNGLSSGTGYDPAGNRTASSVNQGLPPPPTNNAVFSVSGPVPLDEGGYAVFTISKTGTAVSDLSVNYATANGTAAAPGDYTAISGTLTFPYSATSATVSVLTVSDGAAEGSEYFSLNLSSPSTGASIGTGTATATINASGAANQPPVANPDFAMVEVCTPTAVNVVANDTDPEGNYPLSLVSVSSQDSGAGIVIETPSTVKVNRSSVGSGGSTFNYVVKDTQNMSSTGTLEVSWTNTGGCS